MTDQAPGIAVLPMTNVEFENGAFSVDAAVIAAGLKVEARLVYSGVCVFHASRPLISPHGGPAVQ